MEGGRMGGRVVVVVVADVLVVLVVVADVEVVLVVLVVVAEMSMQPLRIIVAAQPLHFSRALPAQ
jgi:hypothetical protein